MIHKKLLITPLLCLLFFYASFLQAAEPFNLRYYGNFKEVVHKKGVRGVVDLKTVSAAPHAYAVGAIKGGKGEITVIDSEVWLAYPEFPTYFCLERLTACQFKETRGLYPMP